MWNNITQSNQDDGKKFLFINNSVTSQFDEKPQQTSELFLPRLTYSGRKITKTYLEKLDRGKLIFLKEILINFYLFFLYLERHGINTKHGIENGHWKIIR